jgi:hypothetical protein
LLISVSRSGTRSRATRELKAIGAGYSSVIALRTRTELPVGAVAVFELTGASLRRAQRAQIDHDSHMPVASSQRERRLLAVVIACAVVFVGDIVMLNIVGEISDEWWLLVVPVALLIVPVIGVIALFKLVTGRLSAA